MESTCVVFLLSIPFDKQPRQTLAFDANHAAAILVDESGSRVATTIGSVACVKWPKRR